MRDQHGFHIPGLDLLSAWTWRTIVPYLLTPLIDLPPSSILNRPAGLPRPYERRALNATLQYVAKGGCHVEFNCIVGLQYTPILGEGEESA